MAKTNEYYYKEIEKIPLLSLEEERCFALKAITGDKKAQQKLVEANLRFVVKIANQYSKYMDVEDLINEGNLGLMHAAEKYNPSNTAKFSTYAVWWIKAYIQKAIRETSTGIKFPANQFNEMKKWNISSLNKVIGDDGETTLETFLKDERVKDAEDDFWEKESSYQLKKYIKLLKKIDQTVLVKRYGLDGKEPMSLSEIGTLMGYSKERIRQIEKRALNELRRKIIDKNETHYVDYAA